MPLSGIGLCDAEITTPTSAPRSAVRKAIAGVGSTPASKTSTPAEARPATVAATRNSPEARPSVPTTAVGRWHTDHLREGASALAVLRSLAGFLQAGLLALGDPRVAGEEAGLLEGRTVQLLVDPVEGPGHTEADRAGLAGGTAAVDAHQHVVGTGQVERGERLTDDLLVDLVGEVRLERPPVDLPLSGARNDADAGDCLLAATGRGTGRGSAGAAGRLAGDRGSGLRGVGGQLGLVGLERVGVGDVSQRRILTARPGRSRTGRASGPRGGGCRRCRP